MDQMKGQPLGRLSFPKSFCILRCARWMYRNIINNLTQKHKGYFVPAPAETKGFRGIFGLVIDSNKSAKTQITESERNGVRL